MEILYFKIEQTTSACGEAILLLQTLQLWDGLEPMKELADRVGLTDRETKYLYWIATGKTNFQIQTILDVSERTVKAALKTILAKFNVRDRVDLTGWMPKSGRLKGAPWWVLG